MYLALSHIVEQNLQCPLAFIFCGKCKLLVVINADKIMKNDDCVAAGLVVEIGIFSFGLYDLGNKAAE